MREPKLTSYIRRACYDANGQVRGNGPRCATCGDLAVSCTHPACRRIGGLLVLSPTPDAHEPTYHRDGTVTMWTYRGRCRLGQWIRTAHPDLNRLWTVYPDHVLIRIAKHCGTEVSP